MTTETSSFDIKNLIKEFVKYWYLFVIFIVLSFLLAIFYLKLVASTYNIKSKIIIRTEANVGSVTQQEFLEGFELLNQVKNFTNEIQILQSIPLIKEVLKDFNLSVTYYYKSNRIPNAFRFAYLDLYKENPIIVISNEIHVQPVFTYFHIKILNDNEFMIHSKGKDVWLYNYEDGYASTKISYFILNGKYKFGELIENNECSFKILLNSNYNPETYSNQDLFFMFNDLDVMAEFYQKNLSIESFAYDASVAQLSFTGNHIQKSIDFVNGLIYKYIQKNLDDKNHLAITTLEYIDDQLSSISDSLVYTERELQNFRMNYNVMNIDEKVTQIYEQLQTLKDQRDIISERLDYLRQLDLYFKTNEDSIIDFIPSSLGINDPILNSLVQELTTLNSEKEQMILTDQLKNPRFQTITGSIKNLKGAIRENISYNLNVSNKSLEEIDSKIAELNFEFSRLPQTQRRLIGIERKFNLTEAVYTSLLEKRVQAQIAKASNTPDCEVLEPARYISIESPKPITLLAAALFFGLLLPASYVVGRKLLTEKISDPDELKQYCTLQRLGYIPYQKKTSENMIVDYPNEPISEYFRTIRSNLDYFLMGKKHKNILITSSLPQEGKSFISINIASSLAIAQQKTLLIGFDLRKGKDLYDEFGFQKLVGISSYLVGNASLEDIIISTKIENLDLMVSGDTPPNPVELISSDKTKELLQEVRLKYDYVIIDTPPCGLVTDSFILMKYSDLNIFVARLNIITKKALSENMAEIREKNLNNTYLLVNSVKGGGLGYYGHKGYPYPYRKSKSSKQKVTNVVTSEKGTKLA
jgi:tyrosine-protein kinase Etk/Wzc